MTTDYDVVIVGSGPTGLTLANFLGLYGHKVAVLDSRDELIDYPRGVGMDDETLRAFQTLGIVEDVAAHVIPNQLVIYVDKNGHELARMAPKTSPFGWPRRNGFIQPLVDRVLLDALDRFPSVEVRGGHEVVGFEDSSQHVTLDVVTKGDRQQLTTRYLVGCDGGQSLIRKTLDVGFPGLSSPTSWVVIDVNDDPIGTPNCYVGCDPNRPYISIGLPHGIRRFEFMLFPKDGEHMDSPEAVRRLMDPFIPAEATINVVRSRVYTHNARVAESFIRGRVMLAGDAAHLMPVWQGQGYNTGNRDAVNLGWKLDYVLRGLAQESLLASYDTERRPHAKAMVRLSNLTGRLLSPTNQIVAGTRDCLAKVLGRLVPAVRDYVAEMRFKPMPTYRDGAVFNPDASSPSSVGTLFMQPDVMTASGQQQRLDDVIGHRFCVLQWNNDPRRFLDDHALATVRGLGGAFLTIRDGGFRTGEWMPTSFDAADDELTVVVDTTAQLRNWFDQNNTSVVFLRPDKIIAGIAQAQHASVVFRGIAVRMSLVHRATAEFVRVGNENGVSSAGHQ